MLDPRDPQSEHVFHAAALEERIRAHLAAIQRDIGGHDMEWRYREIIEGIIPELRRLNEEHFDSSAGITRQLAALEAAAGRHDIEQAWSLFIAFAESPGENFGTWAI